MPKFTKGPWKFRPITENADGGRIVALQLETLHRPVPHNDPVIMAVRKDWTNYLVRSEQGQANARLIEDGPRLYAALAALVDWAREHTSPLDENSPHDLLVEAVDVLQDIDGVKQRHVWPHQPRPERFEYASDRGLPEWDEPEQLTPEQEQEAFYEEQIRKYGR